MRLLLSFSAFTMVALLSPRAPAAEPLAINAPAPAFTLNTQEGKPLSLHAQQGHWVVLYFYPADFTGGCTREAHNFQRDIAQYEKLNAMVIGVSTQDESSHQKFCAKEGLSFKLLADTKGEVAAKYGAVSDMLVTQLAKRHTFLIDDKGVIRKIYRDVDPATHSAEVLRDLAALQTGAAAAPGPKKP